MNVAFSFACLAHPGQVQRLERVARLPGGAHPAMLELHHGRGRSEQGDSAHPRGYVAAEKQVRFETQAEWGRPIWYHSAYARRSA